ncbi:hypothetical protein [Photobacterium aquae]|nr:hypothetical protein [Photobacterium aquae]
MIEIYFQFFLFVILTFAFPFLCLKIKFLNPFKTSLVTFSNTKREFRKETIVFVLKKSIKMVAILISSLFPYFFILSELSALDLIVIFAITFLFSCSIVKPVIRDSKAKGITIELNTACSQSATIHLSKIDEQFSRRIYKDLEVAISESKRVGITKMVMISPIFSIKKELRNFKVFERMVTRNGFILVSRRMKWYEGIPTRVMFSVLRGVRDSHALDSLGGMWVRVELRAITDTN